MSSDPILMTSREPPGDGAAMPCVRRWILCVPFDELEKQQSFLGHNIMCLYFEKSLTVITLAVLFTFLIR